MLDGYGDGTFRPEAILTRAQFCKMVVYAMGAEDELGLYRTVTVFPDVKPSHWAAGYINMAAKGKKVISGYPDGRFGPACTMTRSQAAVMVNRMLGRRADPDFISSHGGVHTFLDVPASHWAYYDICEAANSHSYQQTSQAETWDALL